MRQKYLICSVKLKLFFLNVDLNDITDYELELLQVYMESLVKVRKQTLKDFNIR